MKPLPQHICDRAKALSEVHGIRGAAQIIGISERAIYKMRERGWLAGNRRRKRTINIPVDFRINSPVMTCYELASLYNVGTRTIAYWRSQLKVIHEEAPTKRTHAERRPFSPGSVFSL